MCQGGRVRGRGRADVCRGRRSAAGFGPAVEIRRVSEENLSVYGADKVWDQLNAEGIEVARCTVERLMRRMGLQGCRRGRRWVRTTVGDDRADRPADLVERDFRPKPPTNFYSRLDKTALRRPLEPKQHLSIRDLQRLAHHDIVASVGSRGDSFDKAMAESFNGLYTWELIYRRGPWQGPRRDHPRTRLHHPGSPRSRLLPSTRVNAPGRDSNQPASMNPRAVHRAALAVHLRARLIMGRGSATIGERP